MTHLEMKLDVISSPADLRSELYGVKFALIFVGKFINDRLRIRLGNLTAGETADNRNL
jgi:hypothetical protein